jgi:hypothetical protein
VGTGVYDPRPPIGVPMRERHSLPPTDFEHALVAKGSREQLVRTTDLSPDAQYDPRCCKVPALILALQALRNGLVVPTRRLLHAAPFLLKARDEHVLHSHPLGCLGQVGSSSWSTFGVTVSPSL